MNEIQKKYLHLGTDDQPGAYVRPFMIAAVVPTSDGVKFLTSDGTELGGIKCAAEHRAPVTSAFVECLDAGKDFVQPDLAFLKTKVAKAAK